MTAVSLKKQINEPTNGGMETIAFSEPYIAVVGIQGAADYLYHRWNAESVDAKAKAAKGSKAKKTDDLESYVYRNDAGILCVAGEQLRMSIVTAARFQQDPRSPRKSAMDLFKAGFVVLTQLAPLGPKNWDYEHKCRVVIQRNGVNRVRPAMRVGWKAEFDIQVNLPEYISPQLLNETISAAGRLCGVGDFRPTYGRFNITKFEAMQNN